MGQVYGTPNPKPEFVPFANLPREAIESVWMSFNLFGEGWGLDFELFKQVFDGAEYMKEDIGFTEESIESLFKLFDTDENGLIDSLEFLITMALSSGMDTIDKLLFCFALYDFDHSGVLSYDEIALLLRTTAYGMNKICNMEMPSADKIESTTRLIFADIDRNLDQNVSQYEFQSYCCLHPVVVSWLRYFTTLVDGQDTPVEGFEDPDVQNMTFAQVKAQGAPSSKRFLALNRGQSLMELQEEVQTQCATEKVEGAGREWTELAQLMTPEEPPPTRSDPPEDVVEPIWMHGQRCFDTRGGVRYGANGEILFVCSAIGVNMKKDEESGLWKQSFQFDHDAPITCLATSNDRTLCATADRVDGALGGVQKWAKILLWNTSTNANVAAMDVVGCTGVRYLDFSADSKHIIALSTDQHNYVMMFDISTQNMVYSAHFGLSTVLDIKFSYSSSSFAVAGSSGIEFFIEEGGSFMENQCGMRLYERRPGLFHQVGSQAKGVVISALAQFERPDEMISGNVKGQILLWHGRNCIQLLKAHNGAVSSLSYNHSEKTLVSGSRDGKINVYKIAKPPARNVTRRRSSFVQPKNNTTVRCIEVVTSIDVLGADVICPQVRSVYLWEDASKVLVGTNSGEIVELSAIGENSATVTVEGGDEEEGQNRRRIGDDVNGGPLLKSHWGDACQPSVNGLCSLPGGGFVSVGSDGSVRKWQTGDEVQHKEILRVVLDSGVRAVSSSATSVAVGLDGSLKADRNGSVLILSADELIKSAEFQDASDSITAIAFSPEGNTLAVGSADTNIYIYTQSGADWTLKGKMKGHNMEVTHIDFSSDGQFIRSSAADEVLMIWDIIISFGGSVTDPETLKPISWATNSVPLTWDLMGVYSSLSNGEAVQCVDRMHHLAVCGLSSGSILLSRLPAPDHDHHRKEEAHCGRVSALCFIDEGSKLVTAGAEDGLIQVWKTAFDFDEVEVEEGGDEEEEEKEDFEDEDKPKEVVYDSGEDEDIMETVVRLRGDEAVNARIAGAPKSEVLGTEITPTEVTEVENNDKISEGDENAEEKTVEPVEEEVPYEYDESKSVEENCLGMNRWAQKLGVNVESLAALPQGTPPRSQVELDWVYGYNARNTRSSVQYTAEGLIVYPASTVSVIYDKNKLHQTHAMHHSDEVTCLAVHHRRGIVATSQRCDDDSVLVCVWSAETGDCTRRLYCGNVKAISSIAFSPSGEYVAVACQDMIHSIIVFDWLNNVLKCRVAGGKDKVLNLAFSLAKDDFDASLRLLQGGVQHFHLMKIKGRQISSKRGKYGPGVPKHNVLCSAALPLTTPEGNEFIVGMSDGSIAFIAKGEKSLSGMATTHSKAVTAMACVQLSEGNAEENSTYKIVTGGADGFIKVHSGDMEQIAEFDMYKESYRLYAMGKVRGFKSLCIDKAGRKVLYGTSGGEIGEIDINDGSDLNSGPLVNAHCRDELHGMATHPMKMEAASVGDDKTLRVWNLDKKKMIAILQLPDIARVVAYSPTGQIIAVGLGGYVNGEGRMPRMYAGKVVIVSYMQGSLRIVHEIQDSYKAISCLAFSADGAELFVGSEDRKIYVYNIHDDFKKTDELAMHGAGVTGIDLSENGRIMASTDLFNTVLVWDLKNRGTVLTEEVAQKVLPTLKWFNRDNVLGIDSLGVQKPPFNKNETACLSASHDRKIIATGDCSGGLSLFQGPCPKPAAPFVEMCGHSPGGISKVGFSTSDKYIISTGKFDRCLFQWKLSKELEDDHVPASERPSTVMSKFAALGFGGDNEKSKEKDLPFIEDTNLIFNGVDFSAESDTRVPDTLPTASFVMGMTCQSFTNQESSLPNAFYAGSGSIVSCGGAIPFSMSANRSSQSLWQVPPSEFCTLEDIGFVTPNADGRMVLVCEKPPSNMSDVVAQQSFKGRSHIFNSSTGLCIDTLPGSILGGVSCAAFAHDNLTLACLGCDVSHTLTIFASSNGTWLSSVKLFSGQVDMYSVNLISAILPDAAGEFQYATGGAGRLRFWTVKGRNATSSACEYSGPGSNNKITAMVSSASGQLITGDTQGSLCVWKGKALEETIESAHSSRVTALAKFSNVSGVAFATAGFISASSDGVKVWSNSLEQLKFFSLTDSMALVNSVFDGAHVKSICTDAVFKRLLITVSNSTMLEISIDSGAVMLISEGHMSLGNVVVAAHPTDPNIIVTGGYDGFLKLWDSRNSIPVETMNMGEPISHIAFKADGNSFVLCMNEIVAEMEFDYSASVKMQVACKSQSKIGKGKLTSLCFHNEENILIAGGSDGNVYILDSANQYSVSATLPGHAHAIDGVDVSVSGKYLRTFARDVSGVVIDTKFYTLEKGDKVTFQPCVDSLYEELAKVVWRTAASPAAPQARGVLTPGVNVYTTVTSPERDLLAVSYSDGNIKLFRNPAASVGAAGVNMQGHAKGKVSIAFNCDGSKLYSAGAQDGVIIVWKISNV